MRTPYLRMVDVEKRFSGLTALRRANLDVASGGAVALLGANGAGKSTLMNILGGVVSKDAGRIYIGEQPHDFRSPIESFEQGISFVSQELNSLPTMSVAENVFADGLPKHYGCIDWQTVRNRTQDILLRLGSTLDPRTEVGVLGTADRQLVEIARALRRSPKIVIFDEPTSSLSHGERQALFRVIKGLKDDGVAVIYITHFIEEVYAVCDSVAVMRDGETVLRSPVDLITPRDIVHAMMGGVDTQVRIAPHRLLGPETILEVDGLRRTDKLDATFALRRGEIAGLWGLLGSGRTELMRAMVGLDSVDDGQLRWRDRQGVIRDIKPKELFAHSGFVTEDRRGEGLFLPLSVSDNIVMPSLRRIAGFLGVIDRGEQKALADDLIRRLGIKVTSDDQEVATLSGGNQQKVVFAKWLVAAPELLLLDEPTRGLDVGAKAEILKLIVELAVSGTTVLLASSELEELMRVCDRYLIIARGRVTGELPASAAADDLLAAVSADSAATASPT